MEDREKIISLIQSMKEEVWQDYVNMTPKPKGIMPQSFDLKTENGAISFGISMGLHRVQWMVDHLDKYSNPE